MKLEQVLDEIPGGDAGARREALAHWNDLAKPLGSLGVLEDMVLRIAALTGDPVVRMDRRTLVVFCGDNGVVAQGVSQSQPDVTTAVAGALGAGTSTASYMARAAGCAVLPVNIGMLEGEGLPGVLQRCVRRSTGNIALGPAMSREECLRAIEVGIRLAREQKETGTSILLTGEMGIGNTTTSCAVACALLERAPRELAGRGAGLSDAGLERKIAAIEAALASNRPDRSDPVDVLAKVGGLDLAGMCGLCIGGARCRVPVLLDGLISTVAALCAVELCPAVRDALLASHLSAEPAARLVMDELGLEPPISAGLHLGEGTGALLALSLLDQTLAVYQSGHTFAHLGIDAYVEQ